MTADLRAAARDLYSLAVGEHGHDETHPAVWPSCLPAHMAMNRYRAALASTPEPAPVAEGLREALHDAMEDDANQRGWGESKTTDLPMEEVHRVIDAVFLRYAAASPSPETE